MQPSRYDSLDSSPCSEYESNLPVLGRITNPIFDNEWNNIEDGLKVIIIQELADSLGVCEAISFVKLTNDERLHFLHIVDSEDERQLQKKELETQAMVTVVSSLAKTMGGVHEAEKMIQLIDNCLDEFGFKPIPFVIKKDEIRLAKRIIYHRCGKNPDNHSLLRGLCFTLDSCDGCITTLEAIRDRDFPPTVPLLRTKNSKKQHISTKAVL